MDFEDLKNKGNKDFDYIRKNLLRMLNILIDQNNCSSYDSISQNDILLQILLLSQNRLLEMISFFIETSYFPVKSYLFPSLKTMVFPQQSLQCTL